MKMNFKYVSMFACAAFMAAFSSCSNSDDSVDNGSVVPNGTPTLARFVLSQTGTSTASRALGSEGATTDESQIKSARIYVFDSNKSLDLIIPFTSGTSTSENVMIKTGTNFFLAAVNVPNMKLPNFSLGTSMDVVKAKILSINAISEITTAAGEGFFMTNTEGEHQQNIFATEALQTITIGVGRAMAKVNMECAQGANKDELGGTGTLTGIKFLTANNPIQMHYYPMVDNSIFKAPYYNDYGFTDIQGTDIPTVKSKYFPIVNFDTNVSMLSGAPAVPVYLMENANQTPRKQTASYLLVEGTYTPAKWLDKAGTDVTGTIPAGSTFYRLYNVENDEYYPYYITASSKAEVEGVKDIFDGVKADLDKGHVVNVIEYVNGKSYYAFYLRNKYATDSEFTVRRNIYYKVSLTSVTGAGASVPSVNGNAPQTNPEEYIPGTGGGDGGGNNTENGGGGDPLEEKTEIRGQIDILPWVTVDQTGNL